MAEPMAPRPMTPTLLLFFASLFGIFQQHSVHLDQRAHLAAVGADRDGGGADVRVALGGAQACELLPGQHAERCGHFFFFDFLEGLAAATGLALTSTAATMHGSLPRT